MKDFFSKTEEKKINKKKIATLIFIIVILIALMIILGIYFNNKDAREWIDKNILQKEIEEDTLNTIEIEEQDVSTVCAFNKYIGILSKSKFQIYGNTGNQEETLDIEISSPLFASENRFLAIAENKGQKIYLITDKQISWEAEVEGNISQIIVNKNGYVAVTIVDTSYKTVVEMLSPDGNVIVKKYLSSTRVSDISISNDNKYLAMAEIDTSGSIIKSTIRVVSTEKAKTDPTNSDINIYSFDDGRLITKINYQNKNKLIAMFTDGVDLIDGDTQNIESLVNIDKQKIVFQAISLNSNILTVEEKSSGIFTVDSIVTIKNIESQSEKEYTINSVIKEVLTYGGKIALNQGTEVEFIDTNAMLVKRYKATQEITKIIMSDTVAGIVYRDKIEIVNL